MNARLCDGRMWAAEMLAPRSLGLWHRAALSLVIGAALIMAAHVGYLQFLASFLVRAQLGEVVLMLGHARKDLVVELAQRPAASVIGRGDPALLSAVNGVSHTSLRPRYERDGDRLLAHVERGDARGLWMLEPAPSNEDSDWAVLWRCTSRSSGVFHQIATTFCPGVSMSQSNP